MRPGVAPPSSEGGRRSVATPAEKTKIKERTEGKGQNHVKRASQCSEKNHSIGASHPIRKIHIEVSEPRCLKES